MPSALDLCELAWADQKGYVFLSVRDPVNERWRDVAFKWPEHREQIDRALKRAREGINDVYWAPIVYKGPHRQRDLALPSNVLWADLDESDPKDLPKELTPTVAIESSPGKYQGIWLTPWKLEVDEHDLLNQKLTYRTGADKGGWGITKVLRVPETPNYKYRSAPEVKFLWMNGHRLDPPTLTKLAAFDAKQVDDGDRQLPNAAVVYEGLKDVIPARAKSLLMAKHVSGDRSARLWELECLLAEAQLSTSEIVSLVRSSVWNKFSDRRNEIQQLTAEVVKAQKKVALAQEPRTAPERLTAAEKEADNEERAAEPVAWNQFDRDRKPIQWMVADIWGESEVGFISGWPKSYKSWISLDLAVSVATGGKFLNSFSAKKHNVIVIQAEDPRAIVQDRLAKIGAAKGLIDIKEKGDAYEFEYNLPDNLYIMTGEAFSLTNEDNLADLERWITDFDARLVILDPLAMMAEGVDEFKMFEFMTGLLKPLKRLRARTGAAIAIVHHHTKNTSGPGGQAMYGTIALWAWEEAALHLNVTSPGVVTAERFSKHALLSPLTIDVGDTEVGWTPIVGKGGGHQAILDQLSQYDAGCTVDELSEMTHMGRDAVRRNLSDLVKQKRVKMERGSGAGKGRKANKYRLRAEAHSNGQL